MKDVDPIESRAVSAKQIEKYMDTVDKETVAEIAVTITDRLQKACENVGNVYLEMEQKFPEIVAAIGFSAIATCNALPLEVEHTPICVVLGTAAGIQHAAQPLIKAFSNISEAKYDKESRG